MPISNGRYVSPTWINNQAPPINASELQAITDTLENLNGIGTSLRGYIVVGTTQSGATPSTCDYLCDGTADDIEINRAIQAASNVSMGVFLLNGIYSIANPIYPTQNMLICGQNYGADTSIGVAINNSVGLSPESSSVTNIIVMNGDNDTLHLKNIGIGSSLAPSPSTLSLINFQTSTGNLYLDNASMYSQSATGIIGASNNFNLFASKSTIYKSNLSLSSSRLEQCEIYNTQFSNCGALAQGTDNFWIFNTFYNNVSMTDCQKCTIMGNIFYDSLSLVSGSGSINATCACNNIMGNTFAAGNGITLGTGTYYNNVTCNGGVSYQGGTSFTPWSGVTDSGTNNYVSNNMPTS